MLEAVVFDFDGLVMDSEWVIYEAARAAFDAHGRELTLQAWATVVGINDEHDLSWWDRLCEAAAVDGFERSDFDARFETGAERVRMRAAMLHLPALPGVETLLDALAAAGIQVGMASSSSTAWLERNVERLGLAPHFGSLVGADLVGGVGKPAPDVYLRACTDLGVDPARCVALEDSGHGVTAARAAGLRVVAVPSRITCHNDLSHADLVVDSLKALTVASLASLLEPGRR